MRRKVNWAVIGATGVLAAIVATTLVSQHDSAPRSPKITVPQANGLESSQPGDAKPQTPTVYIPIVPPVAVTSASSAVQTPAQPPAAAPSSETPVRPVEQVVAPKKNPPAAPVPPKNTVSPTKTVPPKTTTSKPSQGPSYWDVFVYFAGRAYEYYHDEYDDDGYYGNDYGSGRRSGYRHGRGGSGYHR
nr:hypothetical protein [Kibdelosporangium sp. MJ126-NF4]CEL22864.1 hypothetical protein [Kibdelosporangium sp. MJ126-NF4]CTQ90004.1 hypothetical protein [Kibdelosporangium sp. MJ126-NF4]